MALGHWLTLPITLVLLALLPDALAITVQQQSEPADTTQDVLVVGRRPRPSSIPPHCARRSGDPADAVSGKAGWAGGAKIIAPDKHNRWTMRRDDEIVSGPEIWQRAGTAIGNYVFRVPEDGTPLCIGSAQSPSGYAQLRRIQKVPTEIVGKYVHFSALVSVRDAADVSFWLVIAGKGFRFTGGDTNGSALNGTFGWKEVDLVAGPIPYASDHISYGFLSHGHGDVWLYDPKLEFQPLSEVRSIPMFPLESGTKLIVKH